MGRCPARRSWARRQSTINKRHSVSSPPFPFTPSRELGRSGNAGQDGRTRGFKRCGTRARSHRDRSTRGAAVDLSRALSSFRRPPGARDVGLQGEPAKGRRRDARSLCEASLLLEPAITQRPGRYWTPSLSQTLPDPLCRPPWSTPLPVLSPSAARRRGGPRRIPAELPWPAHLRRLALPSNGKARIRVAPRRIPPGRRRLLVRARPGRSSAAPPSLCRPLCPLLVDPPRPPYVLIFWLAEIPHHPFPPNRPRTPQGSKDRPRPPPVCCSPDLAPAARPPRRRDWVGKAVHRTPTAAPAREARHARATCPLRLGSLER